MKRRVHLLALSLGCALLGGPSLRASALDDLINAAGQGLPDVPPPSQTDDDEAERERQERDRQRMEEQRQEEERRWQERVEEDRRRQERDEAERQRQEQDEAERRRQEQAEAERRRQQQQQQSQDEEEEAERRRQRQEQYEDERQAQADRDQRARDERERQQREQGRLEQDRQREEQERLAQERQRLERERLAREEQERLRREAEARRERQRQQASVARQHWVGEDERNRAAFDDVFNPSTANPAGDAPGVVDLSSARALTPTLLRGAPGTGPGLRTKLPPLPPAEFTLASGGDVPPPTVQPFWRPDWERKLKDMGFAYASLYLKAKIDGLGSIPEMLKDSLDLREKLSRRFTSHVENVFTTAQLATNPEADLGALADRAELQFTSFAAAVDEDARNGIRDTVATTGGGALGEGAEAAEYGVAAGREHLQDLQELKKWCAENPERGR